MAGVRNGDQIAQRAYEAHEKTAYGSVEIPFSELRPEIKKVWEEVGVEAVEYFIEVLPYSRSGQDSVLAALLVAEIGQAFAANDNTEVYTNDTKGDTKGNN